MDDLGYLFAAYTVIWLAVFCYLVYLHLKQKRLQQQIDFLTGYAEESDTNNT
jgi:CcmD family protein